MILRLFLGLILFWVVLRVFRAVARVMLSRSASRGGESRPGSGEPEDTPLVKGERVIDVEFTERAPGEDPERESNRRDG